jgi:hypothetical protein
MSLTHSVRSPGRQMNIIFLNDIKRTPCFSLRMQQLGNFQKNYVRDRNAGGRICLLSTIYFLLDAELPTACKISFLWSFENCTFGYKAFGSFLRKRRTQRLEKVGKYFTEKNVIGWKLAYKNTSLNNSNLTFTVGRKLLLN